MRKLMLTTGLLLALLAFQFPLAAQPACDLTSVDAYIQRGDSSYDAGDYASAVADYTCAIQLAPGDANLYNRRGNAYSALEENDRALADYDQSIALEQDEPYIPYYNRGTLYLAMREYAKAEADFNTALTYNPDYSPAYNNRGNVYYEQGDYERAIKDYDRAIELGGDEVHIPYYNRGNAYYELGDYSQALADLSQSITFRPDYDIAYLGRAETYRTLGDDRAYADFLQWITLIQKHSFDQALSLPITNNRLTLTEGTVYRIPFTAQGGQTINAAARTATGAEVDPLLVILDPDGAPVAADDDSGVNLDAVIAGFKAPASGAYTLLVSHAAGGSEGELSLTLNVGGEPSETFTLYTLVVGQRATVFTTGRDRLNLRSGPGLNFDILAKLERGTLVTLLEGPRKADSYVWWRIRTDDGAEGWSVERVEEEQMLQPALVVGGQALVITQGDTLNVRAGPGLSFEVLTELESGAVVTLLEAPQEADNFRWWKIRTGDGIEGWSVESADGVRTLIGKHTPED